MNVKDSTNEGKFRRRERTKSIILSKHTALLCHISSDVCAQNKTNYRCKMIERQIFKSRRKISTMRTKLIKVMVLSKHTALVTWVCIRLVFNVVCSLSQCRTGKYCCHDHRGMKVKQNWKWKFLKSEMLLYVLNITSISILFVCKYYCSCFCFSPAGWCMSVSLCLCAHGHSAAVKHRIRRDLCQWHTYI